MQNQFEGSFAHAFSQARGRSNDVGRFGDRDGSGNGRAGPAGPRCVHLATGVPTLRPPTSGYTAPEADFDYSFDGVLIQREQHGQQEGQVDFTTMPGGANEATSCGTALSDYEDTSGTRTLRPVDTAELRIRLCGDDLEESAETFEVRLSNARGAPGMVLTFPGQATVTIVDNDGPNRISFASDSGSQFENRGDLELLIVRQGEAPLPAASVRLTTADGTATAGSDYESVDEVVSFNAGQITKRVPLSLLDNCAPEGTESFTANLSEVSGSTLVAPTSATIDIMDDDGQASDSTPPVTTFHLPQNGKTYGPRHTATKQVHISPSDEASGLDHTCGAMVQLALRRKMRNGSCQWWGGARWRARPCDSKRWLKMPLEQCPDPNRCLIFYTLDKRLKPTTRKTGIAYYKAWTRSRDTAGNLETDFDAGRNQSRFRVNS